MNIVIYLVGVEKSKPFENIQIMMVIEIMIYKRVEEVGNPVEPDVKRYLLGDRLVELGESFEVGIIGEEEEMGDEIFGLVDFVPEHVRDGEYGLLDPLFVGVLDGCGEAEEMPIVPGLAVLHILVRVFSGLHELQIELEVGLVEIVV